MIHHGKKIIAIVSSPRKGNSEILVDQFIAGAKISGNTAEKVCLREYKINCCLGCGRCMGNGGVCVQKDDMTEILKKMHEADIILLSTPVYKSCMCAQLKTLIDRMFAANQTLKNKEFYFIATGAASREGIKSTMISMRGCTYALEGAVVKGEIYGVHAVEIGDVRKTPAMQEAYDAGKNC